MDTNKKQTEIYTGTALVSIRREAAKMGFIVTAYVNGISLRAPSNVLSTLKLRNMFVDAILIAADCDPDLVDDSVFEQIHNTVKAYIVA